MAARAELRNALKHLRAHFIGRHGQPTGDIHPYARYMVEAVKSNKDADGADSLVKDLENYSYYLSALVEKKRLLSNFGGDSVRGITAKQRIENTSQRVGLRLPQGSFQNAETQESKPPRLGLRPGEKKPSLRSLREELNDVVKTGGA